MMNRAVGALRCLAFGHRTFGVALSLAVVASPALAQNLVTNGTFAVTGGTQSFQFGTYGGYTNSTESLNGWSSPSGYNYVFLPTSTVAVGDYGNLSLWSPVSSPASANGFTNASPTGGNFIAADSDYGTVAITQTITGLVVGKTYALSFAWAGAQQAGTSYTSATTDQWQVSMIGTSTTTQDTSVINVAGEGFSGWMNQTFYYVANATTETLSFLANGSPAVPPFALLANVSLTLAPEPAGIAVMLTGVAGLFGVARRRATASKASGAT